MNIILESQITDDIKSKYMLLELDTFRIKDKDQPITAFCLVDPMDIDEMMECQQFVDLHSNLTPNYRKQNWNYVEQAIEHLHGRWSGQLDSFYDELIARVGRLRQQAPDDSWDGIIDRN